MKKERFKFERTMFAKLFGVRAPFSSPVKEAYIFSIDDHALVFSLTPDRHAC